MMKHKRVLVVLAMLALVLTLAVPVSAEQLGTQIVMENGALRYSSDGGQTWLPGLPEGATVIISMNDEAPELSVALETAQSEPHVLDLEALPVLVNEAGEAGEQGILVKPGQTLTFTQNITESSQPVSQTVTVMSGMSDCPCCRMMHGGAPTETSIVRVIESTDGLTSVTISSATDDEAEAEAEALPVDEEENKAVSQVVVSEPEPEAEEVENESVSTVVSNPFIKEQPVAKEAPVTPEVPVTETPAAQAPAEAEIVDPNKPAFAVASKQIEAVDEPVNIVGSSTPEATPKAQEIESESVSIVVTNPFIKEQPVAKEAPATVAKEVPAAQTPAQTPAQAPAQASAEAPAEAPAEDLNKPAFAVVAKQTEAAKAVEEVKAAGAAAVEPKQPDAPAPAPAPAVVPTSEFEPMTGDAPAEVDLAKPAFAVGEETPVSNSDTTPAQPAVEAQPAEQHSSPAFQVEPIPMQSDMQQILVWQDMYGNPLFSFDNGLTWTTQLPESMMQGATAPTP